MMQKIFKTPAAISEGTPKDLIAAIKKVFLKGVKGTEFIFKGSFDYKADPKTKLPEKAPMLFIGAPSGKWNDYIKAFKGEPDFAEGYCKAITDDTGALVLQMQVVNGKGGKDAQIRELNNQILKKAGAWAQLVDKVELVQDDDKDNIHIDSHAGENMPQEDAPSSTPTSQDDDTDKTKAITAKELAFSFNAIFQNYKEVRDSEHDMEDVRSLYKDLEDWMKDYNTLSEPSKAALKTQAENHAKIVDGVKKVMKADEHIDDKVGALVNFVKDYVASPNHQAPDAQNIKKQALATIAELEKYAQFVGANEILAQCAAIKPLLAD